MVESTAETLDLDRILSDKIRDSEEQNCRCWKILLPGKRNQSALCNNLYSQTSSAIKEGNNVSKKFPSTKELTQGC